MHWIVQNNLYNERNFELLIEALDSLKLPYSTHKCIPFVGTLDPEPTIPNGSCVVAMGGVSLGIEARRRYWRPGVFTGNSFNYYRQVYHWGDAMLNHDAVFCTIDQLTERPGPFFIRPQYDDKCFVGQVMDWPTFLEWKAKILAIPPADKPTINAATKILAATVKQIYNETRVWMVDGKVATASLYKVGDRKLFSADVFPAIPKFAVELAKKWMPHRAYVVDIADTPEGLKVVEVNTLNSSGFYAGDVQKLIMAIETALW